MKTLLIIVFIFTLSIITSAQKIDTLNQQSIDVINQRVKDKRYWILLVSEIEDYTIKEMTSAIGDSTFVKHIFDEKGNDISEKLVLSKKEFDSIKKAVYNLKSFQWLETDVKKLNLDRIRTISSDSSLHPSLDISIKYRIVPPIFFRNGEYCFLYFDYTCGPLCGGTRFEILKKTANKWKLWKILILSNS